ncbi:hypothetical protein ABBQ38_004979 [Trebouxia sp. C0009 RCD-2024]
MPPSTAASQWFEPGDNVPSGCEETRLQQAQLADWLMQGEAFPAKSPEGAAEEAVILKAPLPPLSPCQVQQLVTQAGAPQTVRLQGVCTSASTVSKQVQPPAKLQVYARQVRCLFCGSEGAQLEGQPLSCCSARQQQPEMCEEDLSCRQYMPVQQIWVEALPHCSSPVRPFAVRASPLLVHLSEHDLCSAVNIGDVVNVVGLAAYSLASGKTDAKLLGDIQVTANNLSVVPPSGLEPPTPQSDSLLPRGPVGQLTALCDALQACLTCPLPQDIMLALLLSGVTAGVPATPPSQTNDTAARNQVHLVLVSRGHDSVLTRTLQEAASSLSGLNAVHSPSARPLLPEAIKVGSEDLCLGQQPMRVMGGSLASNNQGIMMLSAGDIKKPERDALASALSKGCFELKQAPSLHIPATAAVWALSSADSSSKSKSGVPTDSADALQQAMQGALQDMGIGLFAAFDLALAVDHDSLMTDSFMSSIINRQASSHTASSSRQAGGASSSSSSRASSCTRGIARQQLKQQIGKAASMPLPCIAADAMKMIQHYYALLRQQSMAQGPTGSTAVGTHTVGSLLRMASASARLHMRNDAIAMPDAVLAIYMLQESLKAKIMLDMLDVFLQGMGIVEQLDVTVPGTGSCTQPTQDAPLTIETKLKDMYDFMANYMLTITEE